MFHNNLPDQELQEVVLAWSNQFQDLGDSASPLPADIVGNLSTAIVQHICEMHALKDYLADAISRKGLRLKFDSHSEKLQAGAGIAMYGVLGRERGREPGESVPCSFTTRSKGHRNVLKKLALFLDERNYQNPTFPKEMYDLVASRIVVGKTDRELYQRPFQVHFDPKSMVLDKVIQFSLNNEEMDYNGSEQHKDAVRSYLRNVVRTANHLWAHASFNASHAREVSAYESIDKIDTSITARVLPEHVGELAAVFDIYESIRDNGLGDIFRIIPYTLIPKPSGYGALHIMFNLNSGFIPVHRELQIRTGLQHVIASHPEFAGHEAYVSNPPRSPLVQELVPDYTHEVARLLRERFRTIA